MARYYRNPPITYDDIGAPVPGWGANPLLAGPKMVGVGGYDGLGYYVDIPVTTPFKNFSVGFNIPLEDMATNAANAAAPPLQKALMDALPGILSQAQAAGQAALQAQLPNILAQGQKAVQAQVPMLIAQASNELQNALPSVLSQAQNAAITKLWPAIQPKIREEADLVMGEAKKMVFIGVGVLALAIIGGAIYARGGK